MPVMLLSQINGEGRKDGERPRLHHLKESGDLEQAATQVVFIYRDVEGRHLDKELAELIIEKNRGGRTGIKRVRWSGPDNVFSTQLVENQQEAFTL